MDKDQAESMKKELLMTLLSTGLFLVMYWVSMLPDWKRDMYLREAARLVRGRLARSGVPLAHRIEIEKFRNEISRWEHERRGK